MILRFKPANSGLNFSGKIIIEKTEKYKSTGRYEGVFKLRNIFSYYGADRKNAVKTQ